MASTQKKTDRPWLMRTYSGHSSAKASNTLYRTNLAKGQTGLSVAFDLPTQTGYDADNPLAKGEVGKVGVPISNIEDMDQLFDQIPLDQMNTAMTINATAPWLLSLYIGLAQRRGIDPKLLSGTTQNDIIKEYLSRGTYIYPPGPSMRLIADTINYTVKNVPKWNPTNICSYHLQEGQGRGRQGWRAYLEHRGHGSVVRSDSARSNEHGHDHQCHGAMVIVAVHRIGATAGHRS
ncbi:MAG: hypothetical protein KA271_03485 [Propionivibrio sp.]|nr:hypothetical protein [Propionivibrio sp.]